MSEDPSVPANMSLGRVVGLNLAVVLGMGIWARLVVDPSASEVGLEEVILYAGWIGFHCLVTLLAGLLRVRPNRQAWLLSSLLVLLIGFGACVALNFDGR